LINQGRTLGIVTLIGSSRKGMTKEAAKYQRHTGNLLSTTPALGQLLPSSPNYDSWRPNPDSGREITYTSATWMIDSATALVSIYNLKNRAIDK